jgi:hypothetical protein
MAKDDIIEIRDPEIDVQEIMQRIRERVRKRAAQKKAEPWLPAFGSEVADIDPAAGAFTPKLYYTLRQAREQANRVWVDLLLTETAIQRMPLLGGLWQRIRREAHNLVLFYVNILAANQAAFNNHVVRILSELVGKQEQLLDEEDALKQLREEIEALRTDLKELQALISTRLD